MDIIMSPCMEELQLKIKFKTERLCKETEVQYLQIFMP